MDGVLTCDPKIHPVATPVPFLTFDEAAELAYFGAQVIIVLLLVINNFYLHWEKLPCIQILMLVYTRVIDVRLIDNLAFG